MRLKFINSQTGIIYDSCHGISIDGVCSGYGDNPYTIGHGYMFALPINPEPIFFESFYGSLMVYTWQAGHELPNFYITGFFAFTQSFNSF